jgi:chemotaxis protein MotB
MKTITRLSLFVATGLMVLSSCKAVYQCGDAVPEKKPIGKRLKAVVVERDQLCSDLNNKLAENTRLTSDFDSCNTHSAILQANYTEMNKRYNDLINESMSQSERYNTALQAKEDELNKQEKLLAERERALKEMQSIITRQDSITRRLNDVVRNALLGFNSDELSVEVKNGKVYVSMSDKLLFRSGSASVESKGRDALKVLADVLDKNTDIDVLVEGHTDNIPIKTAQFRDNWDLSVVRATSIVRVLTDDYKTSPLRVTASGKGEFMPRASNASPDGRASNRRTEIILSPKLDELMKLLEGK